MHDIVLPAPLPLWPPAPGWLWLLAIAAGIALALALRWLLRFQRNRYRREALAELRRLEQLALLPGRGAEVLTGLSVLLKRSVLSAYPRVQVARLTGQAWFAFLDETGATGFGKGLGSALEQADYLGGGSDWSTPQLQQLGTEVRRWICQHRAAPTSTGAEAP
ncbi:MAG: DUF4381 domain-containing protein [Parahaliea sp.]